MPVLSDNISFGEVIDFIENIARVPCLYGNEHNI